jgi:p24 family protein beta-1
MHPAFKSLLILSFIALSKQYSITVEPGESSCFSVTAAQGDSCSGSFEVLTNDPTPVIVSVIGPGPAHKNHFESKQKKGPDAKTEKELSEGEFSFDAEASGEYEMCISNGAEDNDGVARIIAFNFRVSEDIDEKDYQYDGLESELADMKKGLIFLRDRQQYMGQREDLHKETLDSINTKVLCWTVLEAVILIGMSFWQISYISSFFETKRKL